MLASPAPTVSATFTLKAGRETLPLRVKIVAPSAPRVKRMSRASAAKPFRREFADLLAGSDP